jgi:3-oxoacyl-[acyl-carrier-protein] synthase-1
LTGHTLGAAGSTELGFLWLALQSEAGSLPPHIWDGEVDPDLPPLNLVQTGMTAPEARAMMTNSFAFGGNNISVILSKERI